MRIREGCRGCRARRACRGLYRLHKNWVEPAQPDFQAKKKSGRLNPTFGNENQVEPAQPKFRNKNRREPAQSDFLETKIGLSRLPPKC